MLTSKNFSSLLGLRGLSAVIVMFSHFVSDFSPSNVSEYPIFPMEQFQVVSIFFILSGISMVCFCESDFSTLRLKKKFWIKRFSRIAPLYYLSLLISFAPFLAYVKDSQHKWAAIVIAPFFLQSFTLLGNDWNRSLWQVSAFMLSYLLYPFIANYFKTAQNGKLIFFTAICLIIPLLIFSLFFYYRIPLVFAHVWFPIRFFHFLLGVVIGHLFLSNTRERIKWNYERGADIGSIFFISMFIACAFFYELYGLKAWWIFSAWGEFIFPLFHIFWISSLVLENRTSISSKILNHKILTKLGAISLGIYIFHYPILFLWSWVRTLSITEMQLRYRGVYFGKTDQVEGLFALEWYDFFPIFIITIIFSFLARKYLELPMKDYFRSFIKSR